MARPIYGYPTVNRRITRGAVTAGWLRSQTVADALLAMVAPAAAAGGATPTITSVGVASNTGTTAATVTFTPVAGRLYLFVFESLDDGGSAHPTISASFTAGSGNFVAAPASVDRAADDDSDSGGWQTTMELLQAVAVASPSGTTTVSTGTLSDASYTHRLRVLEVADSTTIAQSVDWESTVARSNDNNASEQSFSIAAPASTSLVVVFVTTNEDSGAGSMAPHSGWAELYESWDAVNLRSAAYTISGTTGTTVYVPANTSGYGNWSSVATELAASGGGAQTWTGDNATMVATGTSGVFTPGNATWAGDNATTATTGTSGSFTAGGATWTGDSATMVATGTNGSFTAGPATWSGDTATATITGNSGSFAPGAATWTGDTATVAVTGTPGAFSPGAATWVGDTATISAVGNSGSFSPGGATWAGDAATLAVTGTSGSFTPGNATWTGDTATISVVGTSGDFSASGGPQTWTGDSATMVATGTSGAFTPGGAAWAGDSATMAITGSSAPFVAGAATWAGDAGTLAVAGVSGSFVPGAAPWAGDAGTLAVAGLSGSFAPGDVIWVGDDGSIIITGTSGGFIAAIYGGHGSVVVTPASTTASTSARHSGTIASTSASGTAVATALRTSTTADELVGASTIEVTQT